MSNYIKAIGVNNEPVCRIKDHKPKRLKLPVTIGQFILDHYDERFFSIYEKETLVCVCVYRCGAEEVIKRLNKIGGNENESIT